MECPNVIKNLFPTYLINEYSAFSSNRNKLVLPLSLLHSQIPTSYSIVNLISYWFQVRVFTYAVGVAATATATVKKMACENKGYFSPIPAMGAINTKVQVFIHDNQNYDHMTYSSFMVILLSEKDL